MPWIIRSNRSFGSDRLLTFVLSRSISLKIYSRIYATRGIQTVYPWEDSEGFYWKYSTMQSYKLCGHLIPFNISHSSKVLTFLCHGETFQCIKCQHTLQDNLQNNFICALLKYLKSLDSPQRLRCYWSTLPWRASSISPPRRFFFSVIVYVWT